MLFIQSLVPSLMFCAFWFSCLIYLLSVMYTELDFRHMEREVCSLFDAAANKLPTGNISLCFEYVRISAHCNKALYSTCNWDKAEI